MHLLLVVALLRVLRWSRAARRTRPEPLPPPPEGSTTVTTRDGVLLHAQVGGIASDTTVVLAHGFLARSVEFDLQWQALGRVARLVRYDHRHHGRSEVRADEVTVEQLADDLADVVAALAPTGRVVLVGHSMGGMAVLSLAVRHPSVVDRVCGVALLATGAGHYLDGHRVEDAFRWGARRHLLAPALWVLRRLAPLAERARVRHSPVMRRATRALVFGTTDVDPASLSQVQSLLEEPPLTVLSAFHGSLLRNDVRDGLAPLAGRPVLVLTGTEDRLVRPEHSRRMAADLREAGADVELVEVDGAGHAVNQTRPSEVNAALLRLLERAAQSPETSRRAVSNIATSSSSICSG